MRGPYCLPPPRAAFVSWEGSKPVNVNNVGENRISKSIPHHNILRQESVSFSTAASILLKVTLTGKGYLVHTMSNFG